VNGLEDEHMIQSNVKGVDSKDVQSVSIEDLRHPFTTKEFVDQKYSNDLQKYITRPVATRMIDKRETFIVALKEFAKEKKTNYQTLVKMVTWVHRKYIFILVSGLIFFYVYNLVAQNLEFIIQWDLIESLRSSWSLFKETEFLGFTVGMIVEPILPAIWGFGTLFAKVFTILFLLIPSFRSFFIDAIRIEEDRSELIAQYAEKNLDVLLSPMRPAAMQKIILEKYPRYGDQKRSAEQGIEFQAYITRAKDDKMTFPNDLQDIFSQKEYFEKITKHHKTDLCHFDWCLIGMWAFGDMNPTDGSDWKEKTAYVQFAKLTFAQCIYSYASESKITSARLSNFKEDFPDIDCLNDEDKREQFIRDAVSAKNTNVEHVLTMLKSENEKVSG
jgi:hypothetical protein